jgi:transposase
LTCWRRQREEGLLQALQPKKRGRKEIEKKPLAQRVTQLEKENLKLKDKLQKAETIIEFQ